MTDQPPPSYAHSTLTEPVRVTAPSVAQSIAPAAGVLGALLVVVGSFMPWATVQSVFGSVSLAGTDGDGKLSLVSGLLLTAGAVLTGVYPVLWLRLCQIVAAIVAAGFAGWELARITVELDGQSSEYAMASPGSGLYVLLVGAVMATVAAVVTALQTR